MNCKPLAALALVSVLCLASSAQAFTTPEKSDQPIHVVADRLEVDNKAQVANFIGTVKAVQGDVTITSDVLEVYYDREAQTQPAEGQAASDGLSDGGGQVRKVVAIGHVKIVQKDRLGVGQKATYWAGGRKVLLEGQATVWRGQNQVSGEQITVFLDDDRSIVHGTPGKRVSVTIMPEQGKGNEGAKPEAKPLTAPAKSR
jgi:lipopolysaccharide export system protein LptA